MRATRTAGLGLGGGMAGCAVGVVLGLMMLIPAIYALGVENDGQSLMLILPIWLLTCPTCAILGAALSLAHATPTQSRRF